MAEPPRPKMGRTTGTHTWTPKECKILEGFLGDDDAEDSGEDSDDTEDSEQAFQRLDELHYTFPSYKTVAEAEILILPDYVYSLIDGVPIEDAFLENYENATILDVAGLIAACANNPYKSLIATAGYTTLVPKAEAILGQASILQVKAEQAEHLHQSQLRKQESNLTIQQATLAELERTKRACQILQGKNARLERQCNQQAYLAHSNKAVLAKASQSAKVGSFLHGYSLTMANGIRTIEQWHQNVSLRFNLPYAKYATAEEFSTTVLKFAKDEDFLKLSTRSCISIAHFTELFGYYYSLAWQRASKGFTGPVSITKHMTRKECILAVCQIAGHTLSPDSIKILDGKAAKSATKKAGKKSKVVRAKAGQAKHKTPKKTPKKTPSKEVEEAKAALIAASSPVQVMAAQKSASSSDEFYKNLMSMHSKSQGDGTGGGS
jgi:hypothetical protein